MHLNPDDGAKVAAAIRAAEALTDGEISAIVAGSSDNYNDVVLHWALLAGLFPIAISAAWPHLLVWSASLLSPWEEPSLRFLLTLLVVKSILLFLIARYVIGIQKIRIALTPAATKQRRVRRRAIMLFRTGTEQRTLSTTGVLLYLSLAERRAEIVADEAIATKVAPEVWGDAMAALIEEVKQGRPGHGMAVAVEKIGAILAPILPPGADNPNELPNRLITL